MPGSVTICTASRSSPSMSLKPKSAVSNCSTWSSSTDTSPSAPEGASLISVMVMACASTPLLKPVWVAVPAIAIGPAGGSSLLSEKTMPRTMACQEASLTGVPPKGRVSVSSPEA